MTFDWTARRAMILKLTVELAEQFITAHNTNNRRVSDVIVSRYTRDMLNDSWPFTGDSIQFDIHGQMINGQHRCLAVIRSGKPIWVVLVTGIEPDVRPFVDIQRKRSLATALETAGIYDEPVGAIGENTAAGMWPAMKVGLSKSKGTSTFAELLEFIDRYRDGGMFAISEFRSHKRVPSVTVAPAMAAVARAYYHCDRSVLSRFVHVLCEGYQRGEDEDVIIMLREWLRKPRQLGKHRTSNDAWEIYGKTTRAIACYASGERLGKLYAPSSELFPLDETAAAVDQKPARVDAGTRPERAGRPGVVPVAERAIGAPWR